MKKSKKILVTLLAGLMIGAGAAGMASCNNGNTGSNNGTNSSSVPTEQSQFRDVYDMYVVYAEAQGIEPVSYEEWLESIRGEDGKDGAQGPQGPQGEKGDKGDQGEKGEDGDDLTACEHAYGEWVVSLAPTCTSIGYNTRTCSLCGDEDYDFINEIGHTFELVHALVDTCMECKELHACTVCAAVKYVMAEPVAEHNYVDGVCFVCGERKPSEGLAYTLNNDGLSYAVTGIGTCKDTDIVMPSKYEGLPVTSIGNSAFSNCFSLTSVVIPKSVTSIGEQAFSYCESLTSVEIGDSVTSIGEYAFADCASLTSVVIPDSVTSIGRSAFYDCDSLTSVEIGDSVTSIGKSAFAYCPSLKSVEIPDNVTSIGDSAFFFCTSLTSIMVDENNANYKDIDGNLYTKDGKTLIQYAIGKTATSFTIPDSVTSIGDYAFEYCTSLTSVELPDSVTSIGESAFTNCISLTSVEIPDSVTSIGRYAFESCFSLTSIMVDENNASYKDIDGNLYTKDGKTLIQYAIGKTATSFTIPDGVTSIGDEAFEYCFSLTSVVIPDSVTSIGSSAFAYCFSLTSVVIGDRVTSIGDDAFIYCTSLTSVEIGDRVTSIGSYAFRNCNRLTSITVDENNANYKDIDGNLYTKDGKTLMQYAAGKTATSFTIPDGVTSIGDDAFDNCDSLTSVVIGDSVTSIGQDAFSDCTSLTSVYYKGTEAEWKTITIDGSNYYLTNATRYYYSETQPNVSGNYWHYGENSEIVVWTKETV